MRRILKGIIAGVLICVVCSYTPIVASAANNGQQTLDEVIIDPEEAGKNAGENVADESGSTVTTSAPEDETGIKGTTAPQQVGAISVKETLSDEDLMALDRIKKELEADKREQFSGVFGMLTTAAGIIVIVYTFVVLFAFLVDKLNLSGDVEVLRIVTFSNALTLRDEDDREQLTESQKDGSKGTYVMGIREILINTLIGVLAGLTLTQVDKLYMLLQQIYLTLVGG